MKYLLGLTFLLFTQFVASQDIGLHPPEVDWQQLRGEKVRVIFPAGYEARAQRVASLIDRLAEQHTRSVGEKLYDFDLILQTPNMTINGYVSLGPFRSEFYTTPPQSFSLLSQTDWVDLLAIHEFRHIQQTSNERRGLTGLASILQGQLGWAAFSGLATPNWFSEGDAVIAETAFTKSGRGRTPAFSKDLRALLQDDITYRYAKARNGSFKDLVPDHYRYGYAMLTYARERFGNDVWKPVLHEGAAYRGLIYSFSRALKRQTGYTTKSLYRITMDDLLTAQDSLTQAKKPLVEGRAIGSVDNDIRNYRFPFIDNRGRLLALRSSYKSLPALVVVGEKDEVITRVGLQREPWLDGRGRFVTWTEYRQDPRYTNQNYSDIIVYELGTGRKRTLTENGHYLSASLSFDGRQVATVWYDPLTSGPELRILDLATGEVVNRKTIAQNTVAWPRFSPDGSTVYFLGQNNDGVVISAWDIASGAVRTIRERSGDPIDMLSVNEDGALTYTSGRDGVDNVYTLDPGAGTSTQLTDVAVGAYYPSLIGDSLYYSAPTPKGDRLRLLEVENTTAIQKNNEAGYSYFQRPAAYSAEAIDLPNELEVNNYPISDFSNTLGGIKLHSWSFNGSYVNPGVSIEFANALNTAELSLDGIYNINEARYAGGVTARYGGLFPVIEFQGIYRDRNHLVQEARTDSLRFFLQEFSQLSIGPNFSVPLEWVNGNMVTSLVPQLGFQYVGVRDSEEGVLPQNFGNLSAGLSFSALQRRAVRQVQSRLGITSSLVYDRALGNERPGSRFLIRNSLYLPSVFPTHGIRIDLDAQSEQAENLYQYPDIFRYARGYSAPINDRVYRLGLNYQLPLLYPDFGILGLTYFKRIRLNAFYDYSQYTIDAFDATINESSVGGQFFFDNVYLNAQDITLGLELAYRLDRDIFSSDQDDLQFRLLFSGSF